MPRLVGFELSNGVDGTVVVVDRVEGEDSIVILAEGIGVAVRIDGPVVDIDRVEGEDSIVILAVIGVAVRVSVSVIIKAGVVFVTCGNGPVVAAGVISKVPVIVVVVVIPKLRLIPPGGQVGSPIRLRTVCSALVSTSFIPAPEVAPKVKEET